MYVCMWITPYSKTEGWSVKFWPRVHPALLEGEGACEARDARRRGSVEEKGLYCTVSICQLQHHNNNHNTHHTSLIAHGLYSLPIPFLTNITIVCNTPTWQLTHQPHHPVSPPLLPSPKTKSAQHRPASLSTKTTASSRRPPKTMQQHRGEYGRARKPKTWPKDLHWSTYKM